MSAAQILGDIDAQKFRSCLTLFAQAEPSETLFGEALMKYFDAIPDSKTIAILDSQPAGAK
jgi:uncharacterized protein (DUF1810 family)